MIEKLIKKYALLGISILIGAAGIFMLYSVVEAYFEEKKYSENGQLGIGIVLAKQFNRGSSTSPQEFLLSYEFSLQNISPQNGESDVGRSIYDSAKIGDKMEVEYLASAPTTHRLLGSIANWHVAPFFTPMGLVFTLIGLAILRPGIRQVSRQSHLSRLRNEGIEITARPIEFNCDKPEETEEKFRTYHIVYEYEGPDGETITGKSQTHSRDWFKFHGVDKDDPIDILADPKNPKTSVWLKDMR